MEEFAVDREAKEALAADLSAASKSLQENMDKVQKENGQALEAAVADKDASKQQNELILLKEVGMQ